MSSADRLRSGETRKKIRDATASADQLAERRYSDIAKALVMGQVVQFVRVGLAQWTELNNGDIEVRFMSGEVISFWEDVDRPRRLIPLVAPFAAIVRHRALQFRVFRFQSKDRSELCPCRN